MRGPCPVLSSAARARSASSKRRPSSGDLPQSGILRVFNHGARREGLIPLWAGEGDLPTPEFVCEAAHRSLLAGDTRLLVDEGSREVIRQVTHTA